MYAKIKSIRSYGPFVFATCSELFEPIYIEISLVFIYIVWMKFIAQKMQANNTIIFWETLTTVV